MLDRYAVQKLVRAKVKAREIAQQIGISLRSVRRIARETPIGDGAAGKQVRPGRPRVTEAIMARVRTWVEEEPTIPPGEVHRRLRDDGHPLGLSTTYRVLTAVRAALPTDVLVRFEGVAGEFAQFDFGEATVQLIDGAKRVVDFAAYRLKYSRWMHVVLVPNERVEALIRALVDSFLCAGPGVPLRVVFDNPKTVVVRFEDKRPVWNQTLAQVAIDYGFTVELCTPRQPQQKGSVENLVGFVKRSFFHARRFQDLTSDLSRQLLELGPVGEAYLTELVHQRPHTWAGDVERLFQLLEELGEDRFRVVLQRALMQRTFGAEYVVRVVARLAEVAS